MCMRTESRLQETILDSIVDGVFTINEAWCITSFNRAAERITGIPREHALGRCCCSVFRADVCEDQCVLYETMETGRPIRDRPISIVSADGRRIPLSVSTAVLRDNDGRTVGGMETFRDLTAVEELRKELSGRYTFGDIVGRSQPMRRLFDVVSQIADSDCTVLLQGKTGTGKELVARAIHNLSPRRDGPFVAVNCGALPDSLLESELFGYKAGAFTDARRDKPGRFALADGGTLFLDEVADISPAMQVRLLRVLQERTVEPLGGVETVPVDVRLLAAANSDLSEGVSNGSFRQDLFYRINVVQLELPPLRDRRDDIPLLVAHFVERFNLLHGRRVGGVSSEAMGLLLRHDYPGNVRELENAIEHGFALCRSDLIGPQHLPTSLRPEQDSAPAWRQSGMTLQAFEALHIIDAIRRNDGNRTAAARELGIDPSTLFRKIKTMEIELPERDGRSGRGRRFA